MNVLWKHLGHTIIIIILSTQCLTAEKMGASFSLSFDLIENHHL